MSVYCLSCGAPLDIDPKVTECSFCRRQLTKDEISDVLAAWRSDPKNSPSATMTPRKTMI